MMLPHLPAIDGPLEIRRVEDRIEDGFGQVRTDTSPPVEVAVIHDGSDRGIGEAKRYATLLARSPVMLALLREALTAWGEQFDAPDADHHVSGADLVEWFSDWRARVRELLTDQPTPA